MKKALLFVLSLAFFFISSASLEAQVKKYNLFEHFTSWTCGPCAVQNPVFQGNYDVNLRNAHHIAFHVWWPAATPTDGIYLSNEDENAAMVDFHQVGGVPFMVRDGQTAAGGATSPALYTPDAFLGDETSPIAVLVEETKSGNNIDVKVTIDVVGAVPLGNYFLRTALVEYFIQYDEVPGTNGESEFPNSFRKFLGSGFDGEPLTLVQGEQIEFNFTSTMKSDWNPQQIYSLAWVFNADDKSVLNSGTPYDDTNYLDFDANSSSVAFQKDNGQFSVNVENNSSEDLEIGINLDADQPGNWQTNYTINGMSNATTLTLAPGSSTLDFNVTPGSTGAIGNYKLNVFTTESVFGETFKFKNISNVSDLVIYIPSPGVDLGTPTADGLQKAGNTAYAATTNEGFEDAFTSGTLDGVRNLYYNTGPAFSVFSDALVAEFTDFMNNGGNVMITGQDFGWDIMSGEGNAAGTPIQQAWFRDYLGADYIDDGTPSRNVVIGKLGDEVFGGAGASPFSRPYGPNGNLADQIAVSNPLAKPIFTYDAAGNRIAGIRKRDGYKVVYLGFGIEQMGSAAVRNRTMELVHDWFYDNITDTEFDNAVAGLQMGQSFPNPADEMAIIPFEGKADKEMMVKITDLNGKVLSILEMPRGASQITVNTNDMAEGIYFYQLTDGINIGAPQKIIVMH